MWPHIKAGKLVALGVTSTGPVATLPSTVSCQTTGLTADTLNEATITCDVVNEQGTKIGEIAKSDTDLCEVPTLTVAKLCLPQVGDANGVSIQVPTFIGAGDLIKVDPTEQRYIERSK